MIGHLPGRVVAFAIVGFLLVIGALGAISISTVTSPPLYVVALGLGLASVVTVLLPWPPGTERRLAAGVVLAVLNLGVAVVVVLPPGERPGYALWYPSFVWVPLSGLALRGWAGHALTGAALSALTTVVWAWSQAGIPVADGVYRVVSPTAVVVVAVGIARLVRQYGQEVDRAHAQQVEAARLTAGARAAEDERRVRLAQIEQMAAPVLRRLRDGTPVDDRLATECRLLEAALRDGIRGRHLVDLAVRETLWSARTRGVEVTLLDDSGTGAADGPPPVAVVVRRCTVELVEKLERGTVVVRLSEPDEATLVVLAPDAAELAASCRASLAGRDHSTAHIEVEHHEEASEELVVTVRLGPPPARTPRADLAATATRPA